jgi:hypothetical protein
LKRWSKEPKIGLQSRRESFMPNGWTRVGTPEELKALLNKPQQFAAKAEELVSEAGAEVVDIFWVAERPRSARILTRVPGVNADEVFARLDEAIGPTRRLYNTEELLGLDGPGQS